MTPNVLAGQDAFQRSRAAWETLRAVSGQTKKFSETIQEASRSADDDSRGQLNCSASDLGGDGRRREIDDKNTGAVYSLRGLKTA